MESSYLKFIKEFLDFVRQKKSIEESMHFIDIGFEYTFGATAIMFIRKEKNSGTEVEISRGLSQKYITKTNETPPSSLLADIASMKSGLYIDFRKDGGKYPEYAYLFEHDGVSEFYAYELKTGYSDSYSVIMYSVPGFKNCGDNKTEVFDTIFSILAYVLGFKRCMRSTSDSLQADSVSGLNNFKYFHEKLFQEIQKAVNEKGRLSVSLISINQLNKLNAINGHGAGDKNIALIGEIIRKNTRMFDIAARYGNKFIILFPDADGDKAKDILKAIFSEVESEFKKSGQDILSLNSGVSTFPSDGVNERDILDAAEGRRIEAKRHDKWAIR